MLTDHFEHIYLINLEHRKDRLSSAYAECEKAGIIPEVIKGVNGNEQGIEYNNPNNIHKSYWNAGAAGLLMSMMNLLTDAKEKGYKSILVLEDDIEFHQNINILIDECMKEMPIDWEHILLGGLHKAAPKKITNKVYRTRKTVCTHCHVINEKIYDLMMEEIRKMEVPLDWITSKIIHPRGRSYFTEPDLAWQRPSFSDITQRMINHKR